MRAFEAAEAAAVPGPWSMHECDRDRYDVRAGSEMIERGLSPAFAQYLVFLRKASTLLSAGVCDGRPLSKSQLRDLAQEMSGTFAAVRAEWVFVAPNEGDASYFIHDCVRKVGAGTLTSQNAAFLDAAKNALPELLSTSRSAPAKLPRPRVVVIPKRASSFNVEAEYSAYADPSNALHMLSGRHEVLDRTISMACAILRHMDFKASHNVLDIGCGDAALLRLVGPSVSKGVGTVATEAERARLIQEPGLARFDFFARSFDKLTDIGGPFDRVVANGCIHFVRTRVRAERALKAISSLMPRKGQLWIGEIHAKDSRRRVFSSKLAAIRYARERHGTAFAIGFARYLWRRRHRTDLIVDPVPRDWWHVMPDDFVGLAARCGFTVEGMWSCCDLTGDTFYALQDRYSCLLSKR